MIGKRLDPEALASLEEQLQRVPTDRPLWLSYTLPWLEVSFLPLLEVIPGGTRFYWDSSTHPVSLLGWGKAAELTDWGEKRFRGLQSQVEHFSMRFFPINPDAPTAAGARWFGGFSFQPRPVDESPWRAFPDAYFLLPRFQLARMDEQVWLTINHLVDEAGDSYALYALFQGYLQQVHSLTDAITTGRCAKQDAVVEFFPAVDAETWRTMVEGALERIRNNQCEKVVLARTLQARLACEVDITGIMDYLGERYPDCYRFLIEPEPGEVFLGVSPELLAQVSAPDFHTVALAGTIQRGDNQVKDVGYGRELLESAKDRQEHAIVVRAIEDNLAPLVEALEVASEPSLRKLGNLQHLETGISGRLMPGWGVLDIVAALHPTPALGGWPPQAAMDYLVHAEPFERGWYAAPLGWVDPWGNGIFAVAIRSGLFSQGQATLFAGAGIVIDSDPDKEWQEIDLKFEPMLDAVGGSQSDGPALKS